MKLLKKSVVTQELINQKKIQIDEGIVLANKIDALRISLSNLEHQHKDFIDNKQIELDKIFKSLEMEIKEKRNELALLEEKRTQLLIPLNEEWLKISEEKEILTEQATSLNKVISYNLDLKEILEKGDKELEKLSNQMRIEKTDIDEIKLKAQRNLFKSEKILKSSVESEEEINKRIETKTSEILSREATLASKERELEIAKSQLQKDRKEINNQRIRLEDREATLEREIKRQK
jgi:hypothetical protein